MHHLAFFLRMEMIPHSAFPYFLFKLYNLFIEKSTYLQTKVSKISIVRLSVISNQHLTKIQNLCKNVDFLFLFILIRFLIINLENTRNTGLLNSVIYH